MFYTAQDLRAIAKGRTEFDHMMMQTLEDVNYAIKSSALCQKFETEVVVTVPQAHFKKAQEVLFSRLSKAGLNIQVSYDIPRDGKDAKLTLTVSW